MDLEVSTDQPVASTDALGPWGQTRRLEFIEYSLRWAGRINRRDLTTFFGISVPQASLDLAEYSRRAPTNLSYDKSTRMYVVGDRFEAIFPVATSHERYLSDLLRLATEKTASVNPVVGWHPTVGSVPAPERHPNGAVVVATVSAIRDTRALRVLYQSMSRPEPSSRRLTPHALVHDGQRWHVRAYCHVNSDFRDFVITRILKVEGSEPDRERSDEDQKWHHLVPIVLAPDPKRTDAQRRAIELDYGMVDGSCQFQCREALLLYALRHLGIDWPEQASSTARQIVVRNLHDLEAYLPKTTHST